MKIIQPSFEILRSTPDLEEIIEIAGRTAYKSEDKITADSHKAFLARLAESKHESVLEHAAITVRFICDRGVSHELVRHRLASFTQESTRYVNYSKGKFGSEITVIDPFFWPKGSVQYAGWLEACAAAETWYMGLIDAGATPQEARSVLPNSLKTEIVMTANPREWLHVFKLRTASTAHPQMRQLMLPCAMEFAIRWPSIFAVPLGQITAEK